MYFISYTHANLLASKQASTQRHSNTQIIPLVSYGGLGFGRLSTNVYKLVTFGLCFGKQPNFKA